MQRYVNWYIILLKAQLKKVSTWVQVVCFLFICIMIQEMTRPETDCMRVGIYIEANERQNVLYEQLQKEESIFEFEKISSEEELREQVRKGKVDCGFIFLKQMEENMKTGEYKKSIVYLQSTFTKKGTVAKETVNAAYFKLLSQEILKNKQQEVFGNQDQSITDLLLDYNQRYLDGNELFDVDVSYQEIKQTESKKIQQVNSLYGIIGLMIFATILFTNSEHIQVKRGSMFASRRGNDKWMFYLIYHIASVTVLTITAILFTGMLYGKWLKNAIAICILVLLCCIFVHWFGKIFHRLDFYVAAIPAILIMSIVICPIIWNFEEIIPAFKEVSFLSPVGIYLKIVNLFQIIG